MRRFTCPLAVLLLVALATTGHSRPTADHLEKAKDRAVAYGDAYLTLGLEQAERLEKVARSFRRLLEKYNAPSGGLKDDLAILRGIAKHATKADRRQRAAAGGGFPVDPAVSFVDEAISAYAADVQLLVNLARVDHFELPPSGLRKKLTQAINAAQKKLNKAGNVTALEHRARLVAQACKKAEKAAKLVAKARSKSPRPPCVDDGSPHGTWNVTVDDNKENTEDPVHDMETLEAHLYAGSLSFRGRIADNPFHEDAAYDALVMYISLRGADAGPYPKQYSVDGPAGGQEVSVAWRQDGDTVSRREFATGTVTLTSFDANTRTADGFFDFVVDDVLDVPREMFGAFSLDCWADWDRNE